MPIQIQFFVEHLLFYQTHDDSLYILGATAIILSVLNQSLNVLHARNLSRTRVPDVALLEVTHTKVSSIIDWVLSHTDFCKKQTLVRSSEIDAFEVSAAPANRRSDNDGSADVKGTCC